MTTINVQFADSTQAVIISYFAGPQDPDVWPNQGVIDASDARWAAFYKIFSGQIQTGMPIPSST